eukprot:UN14854
MGTAKGLGEVLFYFYKEGLAWLFTYFT